MPTIKRCVTAFGFDVNGVTRVIPAGMLVGSDDIAFRNFKDYFEDVETHVDEQRKIQDRAEGVVEQATAAPGEKRSTVRPATTTTTTTTTVAKPTASKPSATAGGSAHNATVKKG
jgi:hypothetical protein